MKKLMLLVIGGVAGIVLLATLGPMIVLAVCLAIVYYALKKFLKTDDTFTKMILAIVGIFVFMLAVKNIPALIGLVALYVLYAVYKKWKNLNNSLPEYFSQDPFTNFEKEWEHLNRDFR